MIKVIFVCHGNICRSPMAESVCAELVKRRGLSERIFVDSAATHTDELGSSPHRGTREQLKKEGIACREHRARLLNRADGDRFDYIIGMDEANIRDIKRIVGRENEGKVFLLLSFAGSARSVADPWYTGDFAQTFFDVFQGCEAFLNELQNKIKTN